LLMNITTVNWERLDFEGSDSYGKLSLMTYYENNIGYSYLFNGDLNTLYSWSTNSQYWQSEKILGFEDYTIYGYYVFPDKPANRWAGLVNKNNLDNFTIGYSTDNGENWHSYNMPFSGYSFKFFPDPFNPGVIWMYIHRCFYYSNDYGHTFQSINPYKSNISGIIKARHNNIYVYESRDNHLVTYDSDLCKWSYTSLPLHAERTTIDFDFDPFNSSIIYILSDESSEQSLYRSNDSGLSYENFLLPEKSGLYKFYIHPLYSGTVWLYESKSKNIFRSTDFGATFNLIIEYLVNRNDDFDFYTISPTDSLGIMGAEHCNLLLPISVYYKSNNWNYSFVKEHLYDIQDTVINFIVNPIFPEEAIVSFKEYAILTTNNWQSQVNLYPSSANYDSIVYNKIANILYSFNSSNLIYSNDFGKRWNEVNFPDKFMLLFFNPFKKNELYTVINLTNHQYALEKSEDNGETWTTICQDTQYYTTKMYFSPETNDVLIRELTYYKRSYYELSKDYGLSWEDWYSIPAGEISSLYISHSCIWLKAINYENGISHLYKTYDNGESWEIISLPNDGLFNTYLDPADNKTFYISTLDKILYTKDDGVSWRIINYPQVKIKSFRLIFTLVNNPKIVLPTDYQGLWGLSADELDIQPEISYSITINPNPASMYFEINAPANTDIKIFDLNGRLVKHFDGNKSGKFRWNGTDRFGNVVPQGIYFLSGEQRSYQQKLLWIK
jgi:hypothetical protein